MHIKYSIIPWIIGTTLMAGCGPTLEEGGDARIRVTPAKQITFSKVTTGQTHSLPFVVTSVGRDELNVRKIEWSGSDSIQLSMTGTDLPRQLASQVSMPISVNFSPTTSAPSPDGIIKIYTNDPETPVYELEVVAQQLNPQIHVSPSSEEKLIFGQTDAGSLTTKEVVVTNIGDLPLTLSEIQLKTSSDFSYELVNSKSLPVSTLR